MHRLYKWRRANSQIPSTHYKILNEYMKHLKTLFTISMAALLTACNAPQKDNGAKSDSHLIGPNTVELKDSLMTPEALWAMGRLSDAQVSPDSTKVLYGVTYYSVPENKSNRELYVMDIDGSNVKRLTETAKSEYAAKWVKDGKKIAFICVDDSDETQIWEMNPDGTDRTMITNHKGGVNDFLYSPDGKKILFVANVKYDKAIKDNPSDLPLATGKVVVGLMYRHWDEWVTTIPHPFLVDYDGAKVSNERDILAGEPYESPMKPFGGIEQITFSPDSKSVVYTCRKKTGLAYTLSTNSDLYQYNIADNTTKNLTEGMMGYDVNPSFSPDGSKLAWASMEHDGYESDKNRLFVMDMKTGEKTDVSENWDHSVQSTLTWDAKGKNIYFSSAYHGTTPIFKANLATKTFTQLTNDVCDYETIAFGKNSLICVRMSMSAPNDIFSVDENTGKATQISFANKDILNKIEMGKVENRWMTTTDNQQMQVWVIYPPKFDPNKKYPTLLYCEGGPQSPVSQFWSFRWNFQMMAANGYIIVAPNRRGLYGFGQKWLEEISGDYGGQCMRDYFTAIDTFAKEPFVDKDNLGAVGASFGGYSIYWIAGHNENHRFKALIAHDGIFNMEAQYLETDEMWFANWDMGGAYWDKANKIAQRTFANSPHLFVDKWNAPILVIHGERDYRILASQATAAFDAAKLRGVPAEMLIFPDENHWVLKPQNGILWQRTFFDWLDKWLKPDSTKSK